jgi:glycerol-3-phosphate O-acyltransferase
LRSKLDTMIAKLEATIKQGAINLKLKNLILEFYDSYCNALADSPNKEKNQQLFVQLIDLVVEKIRHPYHFQIFHQSIRHPFDYYAFGLEFMKPFVDFSRSKIFGVESIQKIQAQLQKKENVILLANHQIEPDPQIISLLLDQVDPKLASDMIFVAGHRVISDPMAIPMSLGRNLLCIYSKKHMTHPSDEKAKKILHNQRTLKKLQELLNEGGNCIYVAPSGGRDRQNADGEVGIAPFDHQSVELFWLMGHQAASPTHFYPLALQTYHIMPPPSSVEKELGEKRVINVSPAFIAFGNEIDMEHFPGSENCDKRTKRTKRAEYICDLVRRAYRAFPACAPVG